MKTFFTALFLVLCANAALAQKVKVLDNSTLLPLKNVLFTGENNDKGTFTDDQGEADLGIFADQELLSVLKEGYRTLHIIKSDLLKGKGKLYLQESAYAIDEVVISASKFEEKRADVPQQIKVLSPQAIQFANQPTTADLMQNTGLVMVQKSQAGGGSPILRGFEANKVLLVVDGVRMNNAIYRGGHLQNIITVDPSMLERAEIVFGPGSVIYGSDALGGVIHFHTRTPRLGDQDKTSVFANATGRYATAYDEKTFHVNINTGFSKLAFLTAFTHSDFGDVRQGNIRSPFNPDFGKRTFYAARINDVDSMVSNPDFNKQVGSAYRQTDFMEKVLIRLSDRVDNVVNLQYSTTSDIPRYDRLTLTKSGLPRFSEWYYGPQERLLISNALHLGDSSLLFDRARITLAFQDIQESRIDRNFRNDWRNRRVEDVNVYSINADLTRQVRRHELRYGIEATYNNVRSTAKQESIVTGATAPLDTRYPSGGSSMLTAGLYISDHFELSERLVLTGGLRASYTKLEALFSDKTFFPFPFDKVEQSNTNLNGTLGLIVKAGGGWRLSGLIASGFRAPNVDDLSKVFESVPGRVIVPNPNLRAEETVTAELSVLKTSGDQFEAELTGWHTFYMNAIQVVNARFDGRDSIEYGGQLSQAVTSSNAGKAFLAGSGFTLRAHFTNAVALSSSVNYTYGRIITDTVLYPLDHIPPVFGQTGLSYAKGKLQSELFVRYNGWKLLKDYNQVGEDNLSQATPLGMPGWYTLNLRAALQLNYNFQLQAALENILDHNYRVFASGISAPGRNLVLTLRARL